MESPTTGQNPDEKTRAAAKSLSLRPSRLPLVWLVPAVVLCVTVVVKTFGNLYVGFLVGYLDAATLFMAALIAKLLLGRTRADVEGLHNRLFLRTRFFPWRDVDRLSVAGTLFGRITIVHVAGGKRFHLAAPRSGLLARNREFDATLDAMAALSPERLVVSREGVRTSRVVWWVLLVIVLMVGTIHARPWLEPRWPWRDEATALPRACAVADRATAQRLLPDIDDTRDRKRQYTIGSDCAYRSRRGANLEVKLGLLKRDSSTGATEKARKAHADERHFTMQQAQRLTADDTSLTFLAQDVRGIGDEAWVRVLRDARDRDVDVKLLVRYANVLIEVDYNAKRPENEVVAAADALARAAVERIDLR
ncbi:MAG TPA: hypothetical protein VIL71_09040 [Spirillospora sp.]